jgi:ribosome-associated protein
VIIASGTSNRQTKALAASVRDAVRDKGFPILSTEGEDNGEWIIVDCGAAVAHIMQPAIREYYHLEEIWGGKAVRLKLGPAQKGLVKASEPEPAAEEPAVRPGRKRAAGGSSAAGASKAPAKAPARRAAPARADTAVAQQKAANRTAAAKRVATSAPRPARKAGAASTRETNAPAAKTIVVKPKAPSKTAAKAAPKAASSRPAGKPAARKTAVKTAVKTAAKPAARKAPARKAPR